MWETLAGLLATLVIEAIFESPELLCEPIAWLPECLIHPSDPRRNRPLTILSLHERPEHRPED